MYASVNDMVIRFGEAELLRLAMTPTGELDQAAIGKVSAGEWCCMHQRRD